MGFWDSAGQVLFGGLGQSTNPSDYAVKNPQQQAIDGMLGQKAAQLDPSQQAAFRQMQLQQAQQLQRIASGQQQGAGELAVQRQMQTAMAAQQAQAAMARGGQNAALAFRQGARNQAGIGLAGAGQAQQAALQDQSNAQGMLTGALGQGRGQDIGFAGQNAGLQQNQYGQNLGALTGLNGQQLGAQNAAMQATLGQQGIAGGLINAAGTLGAAAIASDRDLKTEIDEDAGDEVDAMLDRLGPKSYRYKDEKHGAGRRIGIMAQNMLESKAGARVVLKEADGLKLDVNKALSAALAASARLNERLRKLEGKP